MATAPDVPRLVGARVRRREDPRLITGRATYVDDIPLVNPLHLAILRSSHAHARIVSVDASAARRAPGVVDIVAGEEVKGLCGKLPIGPTFPNQKFPARWPLATDEVRFAGDPVVAIVAESRAEAEDAVSLINIVYEPLPPVIDLERAAAPDAPKVYRDFADNVSFTLSMSHGDVDGAFARAHQLVRGRIVNQRVIALPMEPRCCAVDYRGEPGEVTIWSSTQIPHQLRTLLAGSFNLPENRVRVIAPEVGGGFGAKAEVYPEEMLSTAFAIKHRRPIRWTSDRRDDIAAMIHGRDQIDDVDLAVRNDGTILGMKLRVLADLGAYFQLHTALPPRFTMGMATGPYTIRDLSVTVQGILTNKAPTGPYRGNGRTEATFLLERMMDVVAHDLGLDRADVRRKNLLASDQFPYTTPTGNVYDSGNYHPTLEKALQLSDYAVAREQQAQLRSQGRLVGIGMSFYVEFGGVGPSRVLGRVGLGELGWETCTVTVEKSGAVTVLAGTSPHGQGQETTFSQIVADGLGVPLDDIQIVHGDTGKVPHGVGTFGSRSLAVGGSALLLSVERVREKARLIATHLLEAAPEDVVFANGRFGVRGVPEPTLTLEDIARAAYDPGELPEEIEPGLTATSFFKPDNFTYSHGCHVCMVEIDPDTGKVSIDRFVAVDDCGNIINPLIVHGQIHGGIAQGIGHALYEQARYDPETGRLLTDDLRVYGIPSAGDLPLFEVDHTITPTPVNPLGAKGVGEAGMVGATPAVANAVIDALGVRHADMPFTPDRVWAILQSRPK